MSKPDCAKAAPRLAVTPGEPAGVGPDLLLRQAQLEPIADLVAVASGPMLKARAELLGLPITLHPWSTPLDRPLAAGELYLIDVDLPRPAIPGQLNVANAPYVLACLDQAIDRCLTNELQGLVTGPLHKGIVNEAGIPFTGHTEYLAERCQCSRVVMMLATEGLRVALVTTHIPLSQVAQAITRDTLEEIITITERDLRLQFAIDRPRILVCGLNPHAGEGGHLGREEIDIIEPVLDTLRSRGMDLVGPLPADTLFTPDNLSRANAVVAMYHDQGLPVLKHKGFHNAVNITLGLPIVRTSVDHGTALDLAGTHTADLGSLQVAIAEARQLAQSRC